MDGKHLNTLEFPQILTRLAQYTSFSAGRDLALALRPSPLFAEVQHKLQETREGRHLLDAHGGISLGGVHDVQSLAQNARRGGILQPENLLDIHSTLRVGRRVRRILAGLKGEAPLLADIAARIEPCEPLAEEITQRAKEYLEFYPHETEFLTQIGASVAGIIETAPKYDCDLIAIKGTKHGKLYEIVFNSITESVVKLANHAVLVCR